ncbi:hypothetical protein N9O24_00905 [bacterium]|nr:hypothetical protein [bacterium]
MSVAEVAAPSKRGPSAFILALFNSIELSLPSREEFTLGDTKGQVEPYCNAVNKGPQPAADRAAMPCHAMQEPE